MEHSYEQTHGGQAHGSVKEYLLGFLYSVLLTLIPFAIVMADIGSPTTKVVVILICAVAQILVQLVFFLHMNTSSEQAWNVITAVFSVVIVAIVLVGSMWIMQHLNHNMLMGH
ncbi:cytochrome o ubiquinol oxidase subunit IV [Vibrio metschnikovii]|uniref:Cytochrome o ubiquinol oxidase subunit IV n=2 Tax=Unclassified Bacteria TaxID=49928 RepID=A0AAU6UT70_UNCXX|nr:cytochrome o ubiquinol oxidase subunit IV [Vibrio metschnikovii]EKO3724870.1 cytochrome o ubiquinol oxidase subunit IV [Vibrio metschnikovii]EKO3939881.1 cytochrome o ubiquinol oxidase subunit IV [Vibrio metschnikovii]